MKRTPVHYWILLTLCLVPVLSLGNVSWCHAGNELDTVLGDWHSTEIKGVVMSVDADSGSIVVNETRVFIVDTVLKNGRKCTTKVLNKGGKEAGIKAIEKGALVYIRAGTALDSQKNVEYIVAKEIFLLPRIMNRKELKQRGIPSEPVSSW